MSGFSGCAIHWARSRRLSRLSSVEAIGLGRKLGVAGSTGFSAFVHPIATGKYLHFSRLGADGEWRVANAFQFECKGSDRFLLFYERGRVVEKVLFFQPSEFLLGGAFGEDFGEGCDSFTAERFVFGSLVKTTHLDIAIVPIRVDDFEGEQLSAFWKV